MIRTPRSYQWRRSNPQKESPLRLGLNWDVKLFVKSLGTLISGSVKGYAYLSKTIPRFYPPEELADVLRNAGFETVKYNRLLFGVGAIHLAEKK